MLIKKVTENDLQLALAKINKEKYLDNITWNNFTRKGNAWQVTLKVKDSKGIGARRGFHGRRKLINACWHVYGDFFDALFSLNASAIVSSAGKTITAKGGNWQDWNAGSVMNRIPMSSLCECDNKQIEVKMIKQDQLTGECLLVQFGGKKACKTCEVKGTDECGGKQILETGKNEKGFNVLERGL